MSLKPEQIKLLKDAAFEMKELLEFKNNILNAMAHADEHEDCDYQTCQKLLELSILEDDTLCQ